MKALICGGRGFGYRDEEIDLIHRTMERAVERLGLTRIIQGGASGADMVAAEWCWERGIPVGTFNANWKKYGKRAGPIRNTQMLIEGKPDFVIAFPGGRGTIDMVTQAEQAGLKVYKIKRRQPAATPSPLPHEDR